MGNWELTFIGLTQGLVTKDDDGKTASYVRGKKVHKSGGNEIQFIFKFQLRCHPYIKGEGKILLLVN